MPFNTMDLGLHLDMTEPTYQTDSLIATEWEQWGEEPTIELSTLQIRYSTFNLGEWAYPLTPVTYSRIHSDQSLPSGYNTTACISSD